MSWEEHGGDWPNREASRFVKSAGLNWHLQQMGAGPALLLLHGTGAATHSWRALAPILAQHFTVVAPDLPGHGFTASSNVASLSLPGMASAVGELMRTLRIQPELVAGHSAGAAILARMCLDGAIAPRALVSLNGALLPLPGLPGVLFPPLARLLNLAPMVPRVVAWRGEDRKAVERLIRGTGSSLDARGVELYGRLVRNPSHVAGALGMMANWDLASLERDLPRLVPALHLLVGENDRAVPPSEAKRVRLLLPGAKLVTLAGLGHLAHEEQPARIASRIMEVAATARHA